MNGNDSNGNNNKTQPFSFSFLELGCGLGVPSMIVQRFYPNARVVMTDCPSLVSQLTQNVTHNFCTPSHDGTTTATTTTTKVTEIPKVAALDWEEEDDLVQLLSDCQLLSSGFDVVLNCDCIYEPLYGESWKALLKVQMALLQRNPRTLMLTSLERRKFDGADRYLDALQQPKHSSVVSKVELVHQNDPVEIYRIYGK
jgi:hypothetical protein